MFISRFLVSQVLKCHIFNPHNLLSVNVRSYLFIVAAKMCEPFLYQTSHLSRKLYYVCVSLSLAAYTLVYSPLCDLFSTFFMYIK